MKTASSAKTGFGWQGTSNGHESDRRIAKQASVVSSLALTLILSACGPGGQSSPTRDLGLLPTGGSVITTQTTAGGSAVGQNGDVPEGTPADNRALSRLGGASLVFGDTGLLAPPPDALRQVDGVPVAILAPLTGRLAGPGKALVEGAQMALFDVGNTEVRLIPIDTGGTVLGAEQAAREAIQRGARLIVGPLLADSVDAVRPIAEAARIKVVAFSNSSRVAGGPVLLAGFTPEEQVETIVAHAMAEGRSRFAVLAPSNEYGNVSVDALRDAVVERGGTFAGVAFYDPQVMDFSEQIQRLSDYQGRVQALARQKAELAAKADQASQQALRRLDVLDTWGDPPFDALLLPVLSPQTLQILSAQLSYYDVDQPAVRLLGLERWDEFPALSAEPGLIGSWFPASRSAYRAQFAQRFSALFGHAPSGLSALAYDITAVAAALAGDGRRAPRYDDATLTDPQGFIGAEGLFRFSEEGLAQRSFAILEVQSQGITVIQDAPNNFDLPEPLPPTLDPALDPALDPTLNPEVPSS